MKNPDHSGAARTVARQVGLRVFALSLLAAAAQQALAQNAPAPAAAASSADTESEAAKATQAQSITITATRRLEAMRDVPASISAINTAQKEEVGAKNLADLIAAVPGVTVKAGQVNDQSEVVIRGVSTGLLAAPGVGYYVDDVPVGSSMGPIAGTFAFDQRLLDLSRVEVLKGPQGTLYGAGAMGGLIKYNTGEVDLRSFSGRAGSELSQTNEGGTNYTVNGVLNVPLSQNTAGLRVALFNSRDGGLVDATGPAGGKNVDKTDTSGARLSLALRPNRDVRIKLSAQFQDAKAGGRSYWDVDPVTLKPIAGELVRNNLRAPETADTKATLVAANIDVNLGFANFSSITGYQEMTQKAVFDWTLPYAFLGQVFLGIPDITSAIETTDAKLKKTTQEFRLVSQGRQTIDWLAGVYATTEDGTYSQVTPYTTTSQPDPAANPPLLAEGNGFQGKWKEVAAYGTLTWNASDALALTLGARASHNEFTLAQGSYGLLYPPFIIGTTTDVTKASPSAYLLAARYKLGTASSVYARVANGYRPGQPNVPVPDISVNPPVFVQRPALKSDSLVSYEAGYKADLPNAAGSIELAFFQIDWKDLQLRVSRNGSGFLTNAGKAQIRGLEFSGVFRPMDGLTVRPSLSLMDPLLKSDLPDLNAKSGERLPDSSKVMATLDVRYGFETAGNPVFVAANVAHFGDRNTFFANTPGTPNYVIPSYTTLGINAGISLGNFDIGVYVNNLTDKHAVTNAYTALPPGQPYWLTSIRPRTVGMTGNWSF